MEGIHPEVGLKGKIKLDAPYNALIDEHAMYECIGLETLRSMVANGETPFETFYEPYAITRERFQSDHDADVVMVTFQAIEGEIVTVPNSYILSMPDANGVRYRMMILGVGLTAIPDDLDLSVVKTDISNLLLTRLGIASKIEEVVYGPVTLLGHEEHRVVEAARRLKMSEADSDLKRYLDLKASFEELKIRSKALEDFIAQNLSQ